MSVRAIMLRKDRKAKIMKVSTRHTHIKWMGGLYVFILVLNLVFPIIACVRAETFSQTRLVNNIISAEWDNPANAFVEDDFCTYTKTDGASNYYNFINDPFTIPEGATINGIRAVWRWGGDGNDWFTVRFRDANLVWSSSAYGQPPDVGCADAVLIGAGGSTELWGATWTPAHINSANFVCWFLYEKSGRADFLNIDFMELTVWYELEIPEPEPPSDPNLLFGAGFNSSSPYVELHWNHSLMDVQFFEVQNSSNGDSWTYLGQSNTANYTDSQVVNGTERYYRVRACNQTDSTWYNSSWSDVDFEKVYFIPETGVGNGEAPPVDDYSVIFLAIGLIVCLAIAFLYVKSR